MPVNKLSCTKQVLAGETANVFFRFLSYFLKSHDQFRDSRFAVLCKSDSIAFHCLVPRDAFATRSHQIRHQAVSGKSWRAPVELYITFAFPEQIEAHHQGCHSLPNQQTRGLRRDSSRTTLAPILHLIKHPQVAGMDVNQFRVNALIALHWWMNALLVPTQGCWLSLVAPA